MKTEIIFGAHPVKEALCARKRKFFEIFLAKKKSTSDIQYIIRQSESLAIPIKWTTNEKLTATAGTPLHQGICARVSPYPVQRFTEIIGDENHPISFILLLDQIVDVHNLGAMIRTAVCAGVDLIVVTKDRSAMPAPMVSKISSGAMEHAMIAWVTNLSVTIDRLKTAGFWVYGLDRAAANQSLFTTVFNRPLALVIGGEAKGIRPLVKKQCDMLLSIPQKGQIDSLNASVAAAIAMYEVFRTNSE